MIEYKLTGLEELIDTLSTFPKALAKDAVGVSLVDASQLLIKAIQERCPVGPGNGKGYMGGDLKRSIGHSTPKLYRNSGITYMAVGVVRGRGTGSNVPGRYASLVEFGHNCSRTTNGTFKSTKSGNGLHTTVPAHPFMRPAWESNKQNVLDKFINVFGPRVQSVAIQHRASKKRNLV
jgi:HK97 gp10 family phage protein